MWADRLWCVIQCSHSILFGFVCFNVHLFVMICFERKSIDQKSRWTNLECLYFESVTGTSTSAHDINLEILNCLLLICYSADTHQHQLVTWSSKFDQMLSVQWADMLIENCGVAHSSSQNVLHFLRLNNCNCTKLICCVVVVAWSQLKFVLGHGAGGFATISVCFISSILTVD